MYMYIYTTIIIFLCTYILFIYSVHVLYYIIHACIVYTHDYHYATSCCIQSYKVIIR